MAPESTSHHYSLVVAMVVLVCATGGSGGTSRLAAEADQTSRPARRSFAVAAHDFAFTPPTLDVRQHDIVKIRFHAVDIAHSFTVDAYRIAKLARAGQAIEFEFRAGEAGRFPIYCNLAADARCRHMAAELVVRRSDANTK